LLHIPKCAGLSLAKALSHAIGAKNPADGFDLSLYGDFDAFETVREDFRAKIHSDDNPVDSNHDFLGGHYALSSIRKYYPNAHILTVFREPGSRLLSHWLFLRQHRDEHLTVWGKWGDAFRRAREPFLKFASDPAFAFQTDNLMLRFLLWPDPRIRPDVFIAPDVEQALVAEALTRLMSLDFVDYLENDQLVANIGHWLRAPFGLERINETAPAVAEAPVDLDRELSPQAVEAMDLRTRLDLALWREVVRRGNPNLDPDDLRTRILRSNIDRHRAIQFAGRDG
jgi:hypothetical protein